MQDRPFILKGNIIIKNEDEYYGWQIENSENGFTAVSTNYLSDKNIIIEKIKQLF